MLHLFVGSADFISLLSNDVLSLLGYFEWHTNVVLAINQLKRKEIQFVYIENECDHGFTK